MSLWLLHCVYSYLDMPLFIMVKWYVCSIYTVELILDNLREVNDALLDIISKWYLLGLQLDIHPGALDAIEEKCLKDPSKCLLEVLKDWLKSGEASWVQLISVLGDRALGETSLARKLKFKYCSGKKVNWGYKFVSLVPRPYFFLLLPLFIHKS